MCDEKQLEPGNFGFGKTQSNDSECPNKTLEEPVSLDWIDAGLQKLFKMRAIRGEL
jgi:hypothetical protein